MYLLLLGIVFVLLKYFEIGPIAAWAWWWVLLPFALTAAWWAWADFSGYSKRKAMEKMEHKRKERVDKQRQALGQQTRRPR